MTRLAPLTLAVALTLVVPASASASFPGANGRFVFEIPTSSGSSLMTVAPDGSGLARLTRLSGLITEAEWSPDGSKIVFAYARGLESSLEVWSMNADGSERRQLTRHRRFSIAPTWSADGTKIAYATDRDGPFPNTDDATPPPSVPLHIYVMNADGSAKRKLVGTRRISATDPAWSPDGSTVAFARLGSGAGRDQFDSSIMTVPATGGRLRRLTRRFGPDELNPNWSPDGSQIAFEWTPRFVNRQSDIALMNAGGSNQRRVTRTRAFETNPLWAPDGLRIAFTGDRDRGNLRRERLGRGFEIYTMAPGAATWCA